MSDSLRSMRDNAREIYKINSESLSAVPSALTTQQLQLLYRATPEKHIHHLPSNAGAKANLPFVTGAYMKMMLDRLTGFLWNFEIKEKGNTAGQVWVLGRLTLLKEDGSPLLFKEQFGRTNIKYKRGTEDPLDIGNDMKAAATDALKKCASELGIARDVYSANEFIEAELVDPKAVDELKAAAEPDEPEAKPRVKVDEAYKKYVTDLLMSLFPKTFERTQWIKNMTGKISLDRLGEYDWQFIKPELEALKLAKLQPDADDAN